MLEPTRIRRYRYGSDRQQPQAIAAVATRAEMLSAKNLDFVSLAICSCVLTLLFHSAANPPQTSATSSSAAAQSAAPNRVSPVAFEPFTLTTSKPSVQQDE